MAASVVADARNRTLRTLGQGLAVTVLSVIVNLLYEAITAAGDVTLVDWSDVSRTSATAVAMALIASPPASSSEEQPRASTTHSPAAPSVLFILVLFILTPSSSRLLLLVVC